MSPVAACSAGAEGAAEAAGLEVVAEVFRAVAAGVSREVVMVAGAAIREEAMVAVAAIHAEAMAEVVPLAAR